MASSFVSIEEKPWKLFSRIQVLIHKPHIIVSGISTFIELNLARKQPLFLNQNKTSSLEPSIFLNQIYKNTITSFPQTKESTEIGQPIFSPKKVLYNFLIDKIITPYTWAISKSHPVYKWEHIDKIIQMIDSQIDFNSKTTDLYDSQYCSK